MHEVAVIEGYGKTPACSRLCERRCAGARWKSRWRPSGSAWRRWWSAWRCSRVLTPPSAMP